MGKNSVNVKKGCLKFKGDIYVKNNILDFFNDMNLTATKKLLIVNALVANIILKTDIPKDFNISDTEYGIWIDRYEEKGNLLSVKDFQFNQLGKLDLEDGGYLLTTRKRINTILDKKELDEIPMKALLLPQELKTLRVLQFFKGKIVPDEILFCLIEGRSYKSPSPNILKVLISKIKNKLPNNYSIERVRGRGYIFIENNLNSVQI